MHITPQYSVVGSVTPGPAGPAPAALDVRVMDADLLEPEPLGAAVTDEEGRFRARYRTAAYRARHGRTPDVYLLVYDAAGRLVASTRDATVRNAGARQEIHVLLGPSPETVPPEVTVQVGGRLVDRRALEAFEPLPALEAGAVAAPAGPGISALVESLRPRPDGALGSGDFCLTPHLRFLDEVARFKGWDGDVLAAVKRSLTGSGAPAAAPQVHSCPPFEIRYRLDKNDAAAVDPTDSVSDIVLPGTTLVVGATTANGTPDYVERICFWLHHALAAYTGPPASLRVPLGGNPIEVEVTPFETSATRGKICIKHDLSNDVLAWWLTHELMHLVQEEYEHGGLGEWHPGREGGAVLAEDFVVDAINRYIAEAGVFRKIPGTLAAPATCICTLDYRQALFLKYLAEQHGDRVSATMDPAAGLLTYRDLLESFDQLGYQTAAVEQAVSRTSWYQSLFRFDYLDAARLDLASSETLLGNLWLACYLKDLGTRDPEPRFDFIENDERSLSPGLFGEPDVVNRLCGVTLTSTTALPRGGTVVLSSGPGSVVPPFGARFYRVNPAPEVENVLLSFHAANGFGAPLVQVVMVEQTAAGPAVRDILRSDRASWVRAIANGRTGTPLDHLLLVVAGTESGGAFTLAVQDVASTPDVTVTTWNRRVGTHYEVDPFNWAWTWVSPDLWVDNDGDGGPDTGVVAGRDNRLWVRLHNQGNRDAAGIQVEFSFQAAAGRPIDSAWLPVRDTAGAVQVLTGLRLAAQREDAWPVDWDPGLAQAGQHFNVRAVVTVPGDPNTDNKRAITGFSTVALADDPVEVEMVRRAFEGREDVEVIVARRSAGAGFVLPDELAAINARGAAVGTDRLDRIVLRRAEAVPAGVETGPPAGEGRSGERSSWSPRTPPDPRRAYPVDPLTLPPRADPAELVTVAHVSEGKVVGGFTWALRSRGAQAAPSPPRA